MTRLQGENALRKEDLLPGSASAEVRDVLHEEAFRRMIAIERKRTERTNEPFLLMLVEGLHSPDPNSEGKALDSLMTALVPTTRETDVVGWYKQHFAIGVLFTGLTSDSKSATTCALLSKVSSVLRDELTYEQFSEIRISLHFFPDDWNHDGPDGPSNLLLYPDLQETSKGKRAMAAFKRGMDVVGSLMLLVLCLPLFAVIAAAVKATSKGPVFFKQQRVGQYGRCFTFLKFRSMYANNDHSKHRQYVTQLIAGNAERVSLDGNGAGVFKLAHDPRITPIGKFLRKTSLDELPQFLNVLSGEMSLVGPRPPIPYELAAYQTWHRRRVLHVKPGITGLWQVTGRSEVSFDEMVRLDLQYANFWSPWLDFKILMRTPAAVIKGAY